MQYTFALLGLVAAAYAAPQGVTSAIAPASSDPAGCVASYSGTFEIETVNATSTSKRDLLSKRTSDTLTLTLASGILKDANNRTGYIAANSQFQFDDPPQTGAIYTAGWSVCANGTLAIGGFTLFQQCLSGDFYNLYLENDAAQCSPIYIEIIAAASSTAAASVLSDGQVTATAIPICQLTDGQPQATSCAAAVTQISDGQIQATTAATTAVAVTQISDGQIQATTAAVVTQISDGQIQAATTTKATTTAVAVTQISDGQIQATAAVSASAKATTSSASASTTSRAAASYTGAAMPNAMRNEVFGGLAAAGVLAVALL